MATERETKIAADIYAAAIADGVVLTPQLFSDINAQAREQAAAEVEAEHREEQRRAELKFGYPVNRCNKCNGGGFIERYAGLSGGRCYNCNGKGWTRA